MREILFRGKRADNGKWWYGSYLFLHVKPMDWTGMRVGKAEDVHYIIDETDLNYAVDPATVGQYTGLTDKNGKKIFEGDIFKFNDEVWESCYTSCGTEYDSCEVENYGVVGFCDYSGRFDFVMYKFNENTVDADLHENGTLELAEFLAELEVIGNIHDNPELMKGDNDAEIH